MERSKESVMIEFEGSFCATCGIYDYFDDIKWKAMEFDLRLEPICLREFTAREE